MFMIYFHTKFGVCHANVEAVTINTLNTKCLLYSQCYCSTLKKKHLMKAAYFEDLKQDKISDTSVSIISTLKFSQPLLSRLGNYKREL